MKYKSALLVTVAAVSMGAASQGQARHNGWYIGLEAGANWIDDTDVINSFLPPPPDDEFSEVSLVIVSPTSTQLQFDTGWAGFATIGYAFDNNWRIEGELGFRQNDFDVTPFFVGKGRTPVTGDLTEYTAMVNVIYDVPLTDKLNLNLGLGAGVDYAEIDVNGVGGGNDSDTNFAYQAIAGVTYEINKRLDLTLTYRYLHVDSPDFSTVGSTVRLDDLEKHSVTIGLRYDLHEDEAPVVAPPPPPPPPPGPQQFIIYFGFDKCNITPEADTVLGEAAQAAKTQGSAAITIVGHTDTMGSNEYNQRLSECRAGAAKTNLVDKGIGAGSISTSGRGEGVLLVKTGDGVKEPQNRRATIDLNK